MPPLTSSHNKNIPLAGVTAALFPALAGAVAFEGEVTLPLPQAPHPLATVTVRVLRASGSGLLDFQYGLAMRDADCDEAVRLSVAFPSAPGTMLSFADFRADGPGTMPPTYFESTASNAFSFRFEYGLALARPSRLCFVSTNAREFAATGGVLTLEAVRKTVTVRVPAPISFAPSRYMAGALEVSESPCEELNLEP